MNRNLKWFGALTLGTGLVLAAWASNATAQQGDDADEAAMMEAYMKAGTPGEHHAKLNALAGDWNLDIKHWHDPGSEPHTSKGEAHIEWIMDGRFLQEDITGDMGEMMPGMTFKGRGVTGYDNLKKKYVSTWIDSMSTSVMVSYGVWDEGQKALVLKGEAMDPMTNAPKKFRWVTKFVGPDKVVAEAYNVGKDGSETKEMQITYTRK